MKNKNKAGGFTLIELMVALTLGLIVVLAVVGTVVSNRQSYRLASNTVRLQESARATFELIVREMRDAGSTPCGGSAMANVIRSSTGTIPWWADWNEGVIRGFDDAQITPDVPFGTNTGERVAGTDAVLILRAVSDEAALRSVSLHDSAALKLQVATPEKSYKVSDIVIACDQFSNALFQLHSVDIATGVGYAATAHSCTTELGYPTPQSCVSAPNKTFPPGTWLTKFDPGLWYLGYNDRGGKSLFRAGLQIDPSGFPGTMVPVEIVEDVDDMQIDYVVRDEAAANSLGTDWIAANDSTFDIANGGWSDSNLKNVTAARIIFQITTNENVGTTGTDSVKISKQFVAVAALRNNEMPR